MDSKEDCISGAYFLSIQFNSCFFIFCFGKSVMFLVIKEKKWRAQFYFKARYPSTSANVPASSADASASKTVATTRCNCMRKKIKK